MNLKVYYRLSDKGQPKSKLTNVNLFNCLDNFLFHFQGATKIYIVADNVTDKTYTTLLAYIEQRPVVTSIERTSLGNSGSLQHAIKHALRYCENNDYIYFVEDDYIHRFNAQQVLMEGLECFDYVTLYDHSDKYMNPSPNPFVKLGGEVARVCLTKSCHWKCTNSTTMTFACSYRILVEDAADIQSFLYGSIPEDFACFQHLIHKKHRTLASAIPGFCTHGEFPSPLVRWEDEINDIFQNNLLNPKCVLLAYYYIYTYY